MEPRLSRPPSAGHPGPLAAAGETQRKEEERKEKRRAEGDTVITLRSAYCQYDEKPEIHPASNTSTSFPLCATSVMSDMNMASFVGKMFYFYASCNLCFTRSLPCLRIYSCPCDEMQSIWGKLMFGCDARLHRDDDCATVLNVQHQQEIKRKTPSRVTIIDNVVARWGKNTNQADNM